MANIILKNVSIEFPIYHANARSLKKQFLRLSTGGKLLQTAKSLSVKALSEINLHIEHGDRIGLVGHNGAGKSTLLRVLSRIYEPTEGYLNIEGSVSPLLDLMFGIEPESTGYENIFTRGLLLGHTRKKIYEKIDEIADFTGLGDYLSVPIRTYSAGMRLRLAFGVATSIAPEILVLDEVVGTGDLAFMEKAKARMNQLIEQSSIVVIATHSEKMMKEVCNKVVVLKAGKIEFYGDVKEGIEKYHESTANQ